MATHSVRSQDRDGLAVFLGWFSIGLGGAQLAAPKAMCKLVGATGEGRGPLVMRLMGLRETTKGIGILVRPRPTNWLWARVAGDGLDLALLGLVLARNPKHWRRTGFAIGNVAGVMVPDVYEAIHLSQKSGRPESGKRIIKAVTINRPRIEVEEAWTAAEELRRRVDEAGASVRFDEAPGNRGTELVVELVQDPPLGELGVAAKKLSGNDLPTQLADDLRRLKQQIETGEVVRSETTPDGHLLADHLKQRAAQPLEEAIR